jgi:hypothetical protein
LKTQWNLRPHDNLDGCVGSIERVAAKSAFKQKTRSIYAAKIDQFIPPNIGPRIISLYYNGLFESQAPPADLIMLQFAAAKTAARIFRIAQQKGVPAFARTPFRRSA